MVAKVAQNRGQGGSKGAAANGSKTDAHMASLLEMQRKRLRIDSFQGPSFECLALDTPCSVAWDGCMYQSAEHALLAAKHPEAAQEIALAESLQDARKAAAEAPEAGDWADERLQVMEKILRDKFRRSAEFRQKLKETGDRELAWENREDGFWGLIKGKGQNHLGKLLMEVRESVVDDSEFSKWLLLCCDLEENVMRCPPVEVLEQKLGSDGATEEKKLHRLTEKSYFKFGKLPTNDVVALHQSLSREHAMILHTKSKAMRSSNGVAIMDLGSKAGTKVGERKVKYPFVLEPLRSGDILRLGESTRGYYVKVNLASQIAMLEEQERQLLKEVRNIDNDAANPVEAAKRAAREEATVFVGNLDYETEKADLIGLFQDCGKVEEVRFPGPPGTMKAVKGICFVVFESDMAARRACGLTGQFFKERKVKVAPASEGKKHDENPGRKGGVSGDWRLDRVDLAELPDPPQEPSAPSGRNRGSRGAEEAEGDDRRRQRSPQQQRRSRSPHRRGRSPPQRRGRNRSEDRHGERRRSESGSERAPRRRREEARPDRSRSRDPSPSCSRSEPRKRRKDKDAGGRRDRRGR